MNAIVLQLGLLICLTAGPEPWGNKAYDAAALLQVTGFPTCQEDGGACALDRWPITAPIMRDADSRLFIAVPAGAIAGALRVRLRMPGEAEDREAYPVPVPPRFGVAVLVVDGGLPEQRLDQLPPIPARVAPAAGPGKPDSAEARVWVLSRSPELPAAPAQPIAGRLVPTGVEMDGPVPAGGGFVCDDHGAFLGLLARAGDRWTLIPSGRVGEALLLASGAVRTGATNAGGSQALAGGVLGAWLTWVAYRASGATATGASDVVVDEAQTTLETGPRQLLETAYCRAQRAWRGLVDARTDQNADHVELLSEYWEWVQAPGFRKLQACLAAETGTTVLLSCFACHPPSPHRATRPSPSPMFTEDLYFRLVGCDEAGTRRFCTECLLYERYEDLLIHSGFEDERLRRLLPFVRRIDREVFRHRLEPLC